MSTANLGIQFSVGLAYMKNKELSKTMEIVTAEPINEIVFDDYYSPSLYGYKLAGWQCSNYDNVKTILYDDELHTITINFETPFYPWIVQERTWILTPVWEELPESEKENRIDYSRALQLIKDELTTIMQNNYEIYGNLNIFISNEQEFIKLKQQMPNAVYIVLRFNAASINFGQSVLPFSITAIAEQNKIDKVQKLLADFAAAYNLVRSSDGTLQQIYETPSVNSNFNRLFEGFRSVMSVTGYLVISKTANFFTFYYEKEGNIKSSVISVSDSNASVTVDDDYLKMFYPEPTTFTITFGKTEGVKDSTTVVIGSETITIDNDTLFLDLNEIENRFGIKIDYEETSETYSVTVVVETNYKKIDCITYVFGGNTQLDTQTFYNVSNFTKSVAKAGTITLSITTYLLSNNEITNDVLDIYLKRKTIDNKFEILLTPKFGASRLETFRLSDCTVQQDLGQLPMVTMVFTN